MIAVDTNLLVYAHREDCPWHENALKCVARLAEGRGRWAIPWPCLHELLAIVTHPRIFDPPTPLEQAVDQVAAWLESPTLVLLAEGPDHWGGAASPAGQRASHGAAGPRRSGCGALPAARR